MKTVEQFMEAAATGKPPEESRMAMAVQRAEKALDAEQLKLVKKIRVRDGQVVLAEGSEAVQEAVLKVEAAAQAVRKDILGYLDALGDFGGLTQITETLARHRRTMANIQRDYDNIVKQLVNKHIEQPQDHPDAQAAADKRDRVVQELKPVCEQLQSRINKVKEILGRYLMDEKEMAALRATTNRRPADFLSDCREHDGRAAKQEYKREHQGTGRVNQKSCY